MYGFKSIYKTKSDEKELKERVAKYMASKAPEPPNLAGTKATLVSDDQKAKDKIKLQQIKDKGYNILSEKRKYL